MPRFSSGRAHFAGDFDFAQLGAARLQFLARFGLHIGLRSFHAPLELDRFALEEMHALHGLADLFDQPLLLQRIEIEAAHAV